MAAAHYLPLPDSISQSSSLKRTYRAMKASFGDGYEQRSASGQNAARDVWVIVWENITEAEKDTIMATLNSTGNWWAMKWTPIGEAVEKRFVGDGDASISTEGGDVYTVSYQIRQVFEA